MTAVANEVHARQGIALTLAALLLFACRETTPDDGRGVSRDHASQMARSDSARVVTQARLIPLTVLPSQHAVCRLNSRDRVPTWATISTGALSSVTRTGDELSIIVGDSLAPPNVRCERGWRAIKVRGPLPFDLIGIISGISGALAASGISIFAFSTYDTDYVMVKQGHLNRAMNALRQAEYPIVDPNPRDSSLPLPVRPIDDAVTDPDFFLFRARVQSALASRDTAGIMQIVDSDILNSLGGNGGRDEFRKKWRLDNPENSQLWSTLGFVLALGGRFQEDSVYYAPYLLGAVTGDGFETLVVLGSNITVHAGPASTFGVIDTVSFEEVTKWREKSTTAGWEPIRTSSGKTGWVLQGHLRSPIDYRAGFVRREGRWWLRALVAGD